MNLNFQPSLQQLASIKFAFIVYNDDIIDFIDEVTPKETYDGYDHFNIDLKEESWIREIQQKARISLNQRLPKKFEDMVIHMLYPIVSEIHYWLRDHFHIIKHIEKNQYKNSLCWKSEGIIDRTKTAEQFVRNESIDKRVRFLMACTYFRQTEVLQMWQEMTADERKTIFYNDADIAGHFWMEWLREDATSPWTQCVSKYLTEKSLKRMVIKGTSRVRLSSFFMELDLRKKFSFFCICVMKRMHSDDLLRCYNLLDEPMRAMLVSCDVLRPVELLCCYLDWPLQSLFLDAVNQMKRHLTHYYYEHCLAYLVLKKLVRGVQDFNYLQLLKDLWIQIPDRYKEAIQKEKIFPAIRAAMSYDEEAQHLPIEELLRRCVPTDSKKYRKMFR